MTHFESHGVQCSQNIRNLSSADLALATGHYANLSVDGDSSPTYLNVQVNFEP